MRPDSVRPLLVVLASALCGCVDFSVDGYCDGHPTLCTPAVLSVEPAFGTTAGGTRVRVTGQAFDSDIRVELGGVPAAEVEVEDPTVLKFITPPHAKGQVELRLIGREATVSAEFLYGEPTVLGFAPAQTSSEGGRWVTLLGDGFTSGTRVYVNGVESLEVVVSHWEELRFLAPPGPIGLATVRVVNALGETIHQGGLEYRVPWVDRSGGLLPEPVLKLVVAPDDEDKVYALSDTRLSRTLDGGRSWTRLLGVAIEGLTDLIAAPSQPGRLYGVTPTGAVRSDDSGASWVRIGPAEPMFSIAVAPEAADRILVGGTSSVWTSEDAGNIVQVEPLPAEGEVVAVVLPTASEDVWVAALRDRVLVRSSELPWLFNAEAPFELVGLHWEETSGILAAEGAGRALSTTLGDRWDWSRDGESRLALAAHNGETVVLTSSFGLVERCDHLGRQCLPIGPTTASPLFFRAVAISPSRPAVAYLGSAEGTVLRTELAMD